MPSARPSPSGSLALALALTVVLSVLVAPPAVHAQAHDHARMHGESGTDSTAVAATVAAFHSALTGGDTANVMRLLAPDVRIMESGGLETREEYRSHHLPGDIAFAAAVAREVGAVEVNVVGDVAWAVSTSRTSGTFRDRQVNSVGVELMILTRGDDGWRIRAIHWSSRPARSSS